MDKISKPSVLGQANQFMKARLVLINLEGHSHCQIKPLIDLTFWNLDMQEQRTSSMAKTRLQMLHQKMQSYNHLRKIQ
jgi:hypothetical protein